jgi:hypothetical protein
LQAEGRRPGFGAPHDPSPEGAKQRAKGCKVHLRLLDLPPEKAAARAVQRLIDTSRFVDPFYVYYQVGDLPLQTYHQIKTNVVFSSHGAWSNDVPVNTEPKLVAAPESGHGAERR